VLPKIGAPLVGVPESGSAPPATFGHSYQSVQDGPAASDSAGARARPKRQGSDSEGKSARATTAAARAQTPPAELTFDLGLTGTGIKEDPKATAASSASASTAAPAKSSLKRGPGQVINFREEINKAIQGDQDFHGDRLLKPLSTFGYSSEMRELAAVISRDIFSSNPGVRFDALSIQCIYVVHA
jgi:hypothetical protein